MTLWQLWLILCAAGGVATILQPRAWAIVLLLLALLAGAPAIAAVLVVGGLWLIAWGVGHARAGSAQ